jgi:hypothetical protein
MDLFLLTTKKEKNCTFMITPATMTGNSTFANNAGKINKLVMVFAFNFGILTAFRLGCKPTALGVLIK